MVEFLEFIVWLTSTFVSFLMSLPFVNDVDIRFSFGEFLVATAIMGVVVSALIESVRGFNLSPEANKMNAADRAAERAQWRNNRKVG